MSEINRAFAETYLALTDPDRPDHGKHAPLTVWEEHQLFRAWLRLDDMRSELATVTAERDAARRETDRVIAQFDDALTRLQAAHEELAACRADAERLKAGIDAVAALMNESYGVDGLHRNGDVAPWSELRTGGQFEEWLLAFDDALAKEPNDAG